MHRILLILILLSVCLALNAGMKESVLGYMQERNIPDWLIVFTVSVLPVFELRVGIPIAVNVFKMNIFVSYAVCVAGNMLPVIPILLFLEMIYKLFSRWKYSKRFFDWLFEKTKSRSGQIEKYKMIGLMTFVAIPLPITGAWTGSIAAVLFNIRFSHALLAIFAGVMIAGVIVTVLSMLGIIGAVIASAVLIGLMIISIMKTVK